MFSVVTERRTDLAGGVLIAPVFGLETAIPKIVQSDAGIVAGDQELHLALWIVGGLHDRVDAGDLAALGIPSPSGTHMDLRRGLQTIRLVQNTEAIQTPSNRMFAVGRKGDGGDHVGDCRPESHALVRDAPQPELRVQRSGEEEAIISGMELNGSDEIAVFETTETL